MSGRTLRQQPKGGMERLDSRVSAREDFLNLTPYMIIEHLFNE